MALDTRSPAYKAWHKARLLAWEPRTIDLKRDRADWAALAEAERALVTRVTGTLADLHRAMLAAVPALSIGLDRRGAPLADRLCAAGQLAETARALEWSELWRGGVAGVTGDAPEAGTAKREADDRAPAQELHPVPSDDHYQALVAQDLPTWFTALLSDSSDGALARALATGHLVVQGLLAEGLLGGLARALRRHEILPGLTYGTDLIRRDLSRHADSGADWLAELAAQGGISSADLRAQLGPQLHFAAGILAVLFRPWPAGIPLGLDLEALAEEARAALGRRLERVAEGEGRGGEGAALQEPRAEDGADHEGRAPEGPAPR